MGKLKAYLNIEIELDMPKGHYWNITEDGDIGPSGTRDAGKTLLNCIIAQYLRTVEDDNADLQLEVMDDFIEEYFAGNDFGGFKGIITSSGITQYPYSNVGNVYVRTKSKIGKRGKWESEDFMNMNTGFNNDE
jgi:hypothetical protein